MRSDEESAKVDRTHHQWLVVKSVVRDIPDQIQQMISVLLANVIKPHLKEDCYLGRWKTRNLSMEVYTSANYACSIINRSAFDYCMFLSRNLVTWRSKKHNVVAGSSPKAEPWHNEFELSRMIILDILNVKCEAHMKLFCNNKLVISICA